jgi:predicted permease
LLLGWLLGKNGKLKYSHTPILSALMVNIFLPCKIFSSLSKNFSLSYLTVKWKTLVFSVSLLILLHFLSIILAKLIGKTSYEKKVYEYSLTISNYAYMGYALMESVFGGEALADMIFFCIPFAIYTYTVGYLKLTQKKVGIKQLVTPSTVAIFFGILFGVLNLKIPDVIQNVIASSSACTGPISMLLTGVVLSSFALKDLFGKARDYLIIAFRLVLIPATVFLVCTLLDLKAVLLPALFVTSMPTGLNTIVFAQSTGKPPEIGARLAFLSHLLSCATLPLWLSLI